jgi:hypothetical protein
MCQKMQKKNILETEIFLGQQAGRLNTFSMHCVPDSKEKIKKQKEKEKNRAYLIFEYCWKTIVGLTRKMAHACFPGTNVVELWTELQYQVPTTPSKEETLAS